MMAKDKIENKSGKKSVNKGGKTKRINGTTKVIIERLQDVIWDGGDRKDPKVAKEVFDILNKYTKEENKKARSYMSDIERILSKKYLVASKEIFLEVFGTDKRDEVLEIWREDEDARKKYKELQAKYDKDKKNNLVEEKVYDIIKRLYNKELVFHGEKTGNGGLRKKTDIDGQASEFLLKLCGFFKDSKGNRVIPNKTFVHNNERGKKGIQLDSSGTANGLKIKKSKSGSLFNSLVILDEHSDNSELAEMKKRPTSTTHIVFDMLKRLGQVPNKYMKQMQRFVDFVDIIESNYYVVAGVDFENSHRTISGLYRNLPIEFIYNYFSNPNNTGFEILSDKILTNKSNIIKNQYNYKNGRKEDVSLKDISDYKLSRNKKALFEYQELSKKNYFLQFNDSSFVLDIGANVTDCQQVAAHHNRGLFRVFPNGDVYIYSIEELPKTIGGHKTEGGHFIIQNMSEQELWQFIEDGQFVTKADHESIRKEISDLYGILDEERLLKDKSNKLKKIDSDIKNIVKHNMKNKISYINEKGHSIEGSILTKDVIGDKLEDGYVKIKLNNNKTFAVQRRVLKVNDTLKLECLEDEQHGGNDDNSKKYVKGKNTSNKIVKKSGNGKKGNDDVSDELTA